MADLCEPDPDLIRDAGLRERVQYLKRTQEGVAEMCEVFEEILQEGLERGREEGIEMGAERKLIDNLRSLVRKGGMPATEALDLLDVPRSDWARLAAML